MTELVRKGALAADRMSRNPDVAVACDDLAGVAEIVRERLRQVEQLGYSAEHDDRHDRGELVMAADSTLHASFADVAEGVAGYPECEEFYRQAGALLAAEMDRLIRMLTPEAGS